MVDEIRDGSMDRWCCDQVVVIQDEHYLMGQGSKAIDPDGQDGFYWWKLLRGRSLKERYGSCLAARMDACESSENVGPEAYKVIIVVVQRNPGRSKRSLLKPGREEGRLAKAGRGCDEREWALDAKLKFVRETLARYQICTNRGPGEFRNQEYLLSDVTFHVP
jgi:hypothetical protein